ncbi:serine hydrolase domain-containing protein [Kitasatospora sp. NPDC059722]|uniref:serine hydrolase domain-containing protein n=1 Tax=Kitasatospora sp. NPDC059722 TaxID=3346925 RepID=UPI0036B026F4
MTRMRIAALCTATLLASTLHLSAGPATAAGPAHPQHGCAASPDPGSGQAGKVLDAVRRAKEELDLNSVLLKVTVDGREVVTGAVGESMTGVPATADMHFRVGSVAFSYMGVVLLQLVEEGKVGLDDPVSRWLPDLPHAEEITLRMLGSTTSGLHDYVPDPVFQNAYLADPFREWTEAELVGVSTAHDLWYAPGTNWSYSHANFMLLGEALAKITGEPLDGLLRRRVMDRLDLRQTRNGFTPDLPTPVLHGFTAARGRYEEVTFWNPSWTAARGAVLSSDICDLARSAQAIGAGELLSPSSYRTQLNPGTVGLGHATKTCPADICRTNTEAEHFGLGVFVRNGWVLQNPFLPGYAAVQAYLPDCRLAIAVATTQGPATTDGQPAQTIAARISELLAPDHPLAP